MQDRYTGDIGDFVKYGLLRKLSRGRRLGVAWYLHPDEEHNEDGGFVDYLEKPDEWRHLDCQLFNSLKKIVDGHRCVKAVEQSGLLPNAVFSGDLLRCCSRSVVDRSRWRQKWFDDVERKLSACDIVFADPDNGLRLDDKFRYAARKDWKRLPLSEALRLCDGGRPAVFYHHNNRTKKHCEQIRDWKNHFPGQVHAYYWRKFSNRTFFVVNADRLMVDALKEFAEVWHPNGELDPQYP